MRSVAEWLFPPKCVSCGKLLTLSDPSEGTSAFCRDCEKAWVNETLENCCVCTRPVSFCTCMPKELSSSGCVSFHKLAFYMHGERNPVQNRVVFALKKSKNARAVRYLAKAFLPQIKSIREGGFLTEQTVVTYVPRGRRAVLESGVDQSRELARALAKAAGMQFEPLLARTSAKERPQKELSTKERRQNAKAAFRTKTEKPLAGVSVILVDDIVTSGASSAACTRLLLGKGAKSVCVFAICNDDLNREKIKAPKFTV